MRRSSATLSLILWLSAANSITTATTSATTTSATRNLTTFPACVTDIDCESVSVDRSADFKCFQFMCFPWNSPDLQWPYKTCQKNSDCNSTEMECFRHQDRRNVLHGICLDKSHLLKCFSHTDCPANRECVVGWCGEPEYLEAIAEMGCDSDSYCEDLLIGDACCYDLRGAVLPETTWLGGEKRCCKEEVYPVIPPAQGLNQRQINRLDKKINDLYAPFGLDQLICEGVSPELMGELNACQEFLTLPAPTSTQPPETKRPSRPPRKPSRQGTPSLPRRPQPPTPSPATISGGSRVDFAPAILAILVFFTSNVIPLLEQCALFNLKRL